MRQIGYGETAGGPVCVCPLSMTTGWSGVDADYDVLISDPPSDVMQLFKARSGSEYMIFWALSANFTVCQADSSWALIETRYSASDGICQRLDFDSLTSGTELGVLTNFGGRMALFDAALPGHSIRVDNPGAYHSVPMPANVPPDLLIIDIPQCDWLLIQFEYLDPQNSLRGVVFRST